jgi:hypothetical protein
MTTCHSIPLALMRLVKFKHMMDANMALFRGVYKDMQGRVQEKEVTCFFMKSSGAFYIITVI